jgi:hypothetical protein
MGRAAARILAFWNSQIRIPFTETHWDVGAPSHCVHVASFTDLLQALTADIRLNYTENSVGTSDRSTAHLHYRTNWSNVFSKTTRKSLILRITRYT